MFQQLATLGGLMLATAALTMTAPAPTSTTQAEGAFTVDGVHSSVVFHTIHSGAARFYGTFDSISGSIEFDEKHPDKASVKISIDATSVDSNNSKRDQHLSGPDFINAKEFPTITFESKKVKVAKKANGDDPMMLEVIGELNFVGKKRDITAMVEHVGSGKGMGGSEIHGFEARFDISRAEFGIDTVPGLGDKIGLIVSVEAGRR